jgi:UDP-N-acetylmuramoyl-tripeptide--D-alanyl-D-alanine ligase
MKLTKSDILSVPHSEANGFGGLKNFKVTGISIDSRTVKTGELFIAIRGEQFDGHNFISKAIEAGASALIVEKRWAEANSAMMVSIYIPRLVVENTIHALGHIAKIYRRRFNIPIIAIGGSNGKTTTKEMIRSVLSTKYSVLCTEGNLNNNIGVPQTLFHLEKKHKIAIVEIGTNHPGEIEYLCSILEPTHGLITNIGHEHLEFFNSVEGVVKAEGELFGWLADNHGTSFINADDANLKLLAKKMKKIVSYGFTARSVLTKGTIVSIDTNALSSLQVKPKGKKSFCISLIVPGVHNAKNALAAAAVGITMKVPPIRIQKALTSFKSASKRMQVQHVAGLTILNDTYNSNPDSTLAALANRRPSPTNWKSFIKLWY